MYLYFNSTHGEVFVASYKFNTAKSAKDQTLFSPRKSLDEKLFRRSYIPYRPAIKSSIVISVGTECALPVHYELGEDHSVLTSRRRS